MSINYAQGYFPRSRELIASLIAEGKQLGMTVKQITELYEEWGVVRFLASPFYQSQARFNTKNDMFWNNLYPQAMTRSPLAYAFLVNPELVLDMMDLWRNEVESMQSSKPSRRDIGFHEVFLRESAAESAEYAAHLDTAVAFGGVDGYNLSSLIPTTFSEDFTTLPLACYMAHLRKSDEGMKELASVYYRWGNESNHGYVSPERQKTHYAVGKQFDVATSHSGYQEVLNRWAGYVPEGTELAWELAAARVLTYVSVEERPRILEDVISSGASVDHLDDVASSYHHLPWDAVINIVENDVDNHLINILELGK